MTQDLDTNKVRTEIWERNGYWYARISSDYEDEGSLADGGGYWYKRTQTEKMRAFPNKDAAEAWAEQTTTRNQLAITS